MGLLRAIARIKPCAMHWRGTKSWKATKSGRLTIAACVQIAAAPSPRWRVAMRWFVEGHITEGTINQDVGTVSIGARPNHILCRLHDGSCLPCREHMGLRGRGAFHP